MGSHKFGIVIFVIYLPAFCLRMKEIYGLDIVAYDSLGGNYSSHNKTLERNTPAMHNLLAATLQLLGHGMA